MEDTEVFLEHFGIKGMHWGIRNESRNSTPRKTDREARKDAEEFARAKLFFGQGAGNRRKLIKATVEAKKKKDPVYAKAFDSHLSNQDLSEHASKARKERSSTDRRDRTKKRAGFLARHVTGEMGTQAAFTAVALGGAAFIASPKGKSIMKKSMNSVKVAVESRRLQRSVSRLINLSKP